MTYRVRVSSSRPWPMFVFHFGKYTRASSARRRASRLRLAFPKAKVEVVRQWPPAPAPARTAPCNEPPAGLHRDTHELAQAIAARIGGSIVVRKGWYQPKVKIVRKWTEERGWFTMTLFRSTDGEHSIGVDMANIAEGDARELIERLFPKAVPKKRRRRRART